MPRWPEKTFEQRFWDRVDMTAGPAGCWLWMGGRNRYGYGIISERRGKQRLCHRVAYELRIGPIEKGVQVNHHCDVPACCNPNHFFLGTQADNLADMWAKERQARGERQAKAKLTEKQVIELRQLRAEGWKVHDLARRFDVSACVASKIYLGRMWAHVSGPRAKAKTRAFPMEKLAEMRALRSQGWSQRRIAEQFGISQPAVSRRMGRS